MLPDGNRQPVPIDEALAEITLLVLGSLHSDTRQIGVLTGAEAMEEVCLMRAKGRGSGRRRTPSRSERDPNSRSLSRVDAVRDGPSAEALLFRKHPSLSGDQRFECPFLRHVSRHARARFQERGVERTAPVGFRDIRREE